MFPAGLKVMLFALAVMFVFQTGSAFAAPVSVTQCQALTVDGGYYVLDANILVNTTTQCFNFTANNITLDGQGHSINTSINAIAGVISIVGRTNTTIKNIVMNNTAAATSSPINIQDSNITTVDNANITAFNYGAIYVQSVSNNKMYNNTIFRSNISGIYGIFVVLSSFNVSMNITSNTFSGCSSNCIYFTNPVTGFFKDSFINNNTFNSTSTGASSALGLSIPAANNVINNSWNSNYWGNTSNSDYSDRCYDSNGTCSKYDIFRNGADLYPRSWFPGLSLNNLQWPALTVETMLKSYVSSVKTTYNSILLTTTTYVNGSIIGSSSTGYTSGSYKFFNSSISGVNPLLQGEINATNITAIWNFSYTNGIAYGNVTLSKSFAVERIRLLPCAAPMLNMSLNFSVFDTNSITTSLTTNFSSSFSLYVDSGEYRTYSYVNSGRYNYSFCLFPGWVSSYKLNALLTYTNTTQNNYIIINMTFTNATTNISLYSLNNASAVNIPFTLYNNIKVPQSGYVIIAQRYYPSTGQFISVAQGQTGYDGTTIISLETNQIYQYTIQLNGITVGIIPAYTLTNTPQVLYLIGNYVVAFNYLNLQQINCQPNNVTYQLTCSLVDLSGLMTSSSLIVSEVRPANTTRTVCSLNSTSSNVLYACDLHLFNQSQLNWVLTGTFSTSGNPTTTILDDGTLWGATTAMLPGLGGMGILLAMVLVISLFFGGMLNSPSTAIILACIGLVASQLAGLINMGFAAIAPIVLAGALIVYKMEE